MIAEVVRRAGLDGGEVEDVIMGSALPAGSAGWNVGRVSAMAAGLPTSVSGMTMDRQCASGLVAVATAAKQIICDGMDIAIGGGLDSISIVQGPAFDLIMTQLDKNILKIQPDVYMPMLQTAEIVAKRSNIGREAQDELALQSQQRTAVAQAAGLFDDEIIALPLTKAVKNKGTGEITYEDVILTKDEGNRPATSGESLTMGDIGLWELNEAFAVQAIYCRDKLGIPNEILNVNGGGYLYWSSLWHEWFPYDWSCFDRG